MLQPAGSLVRARSPDAPVRTAVGPVELCGEGDRFHDYVLEPYDALAPAAGKLRSVNVLYESFAIAGVEEAGRRIVDLVRGGLGPFRTVWGIKRTGAGDADLAWELYFYDFERVHADLSLGSVRQMLAPAVALEVEEPRVLPWHMFSVDLGLEQLQGRAPGEVHVYIDMRCYALRGRTLELENIYTFHDPRREIDEILHRLRSSVHFDERRDNLGRLVTPALLRCGRMCVANKRNADAVYFSRVRTPALLEVLSREQWPASLCGFVHAQQPALDHLLWDVGIDFRAGPGGMELGKTGIYGSF
jgi:hypothetical protein